KFMDDLGEAIRHGLPEDAALAMLTTNSASILGVDDQLGRIAPGYLANFVVVDGSLFGKSSEIRDVWVGGRCNEITPKDAINLVGQWAATFEGGRHAALKIAKGNKLTFDFEEHE